MDHEALTPAVRRLLDDPRVDPEREVSGTEEAAHAVRLLDQGLREGPGVFRRMAEGAQRGAETLPSDPLQVLSEFVQNANDARASQLRFLWRPDALLIAHDGVSVRMGDVLLLGMPWLGGKTADAQSTGVSASGCQRSGHSQRPGKSTAIPSTYSSPISPWNQSLRRSYQKRSPDPNGRSSVSLWSRTRCPPPISSNGSKGRLTCAAALPRARTHDSRRVIQRQDAPSGQRPETGCPPEGSFGAEYPQMWPITDC